MYIYIYIYVYIYIYIYIYVCMYIYIYIYIYTSGAYVAIRQQEVVQETQGESLPCMAANEEGIKKGLSSA